MITQTGGNFKLAPWDWRYYAEKVRQAQYGLDENELRQYFPLDKVREGAFYTANKLYGITFEQRNDLPLPHPEALAFEVKDADGSPIGIYYVDYFPRPGKSQGAWMEAFRPQSGLLNSTPVITNVCNFTKPTGETPALLTFDEVQTLFHEFGHALHGLLSQCTYPSVAGTNVYRDFVELPSQIMENWAADPEVLKVYARHYKTGANIPQALIDKLQKAVISTRDSLQRNLWRLPYWTWLTIPEKQPIPSMWKNLRKKHWKNSDSCLPSLCATGAPTSPTYSKAPIPMPPDIMHTPGRKYWMPMLLQHLKKPEIFLTRKKQRLSENISFQKAAATTR